MSEPLLTPRYPGLREMDAGPGCRAWPWDRCHQARVRHALEPEWEARFEPCSYGFRPGRGCHDAIEAIDHHDVEVQDEAGRVLGRARLGEGVAGVTWFHELIGRFADPDAC